ncbi:MAG: acetoin transporter permease [Paenibacillus sp.]|jgi:ABC-2 type transport system permease protein|nr:acetoin transporter permease [Paenibacillus sp.]
MLSKALWWKEYKQVKWIIWLFPVIHFLTLGLQRLDTWVLDDEERIEHALRYAVDTAGAFGGGDLESSSRMVLTLVLAVLAGMLTGAERRNGIQEMSFALPYSRKQLFWTKWMLGLGLIVISVAVNSVIDMIVIHNSPIAEYFNLRYHGFQMIYSCFVLMSVYSTVLFIGTLSGSMAAQMIFSAILAYFPVGLSALIGKFMDVHGYGYTNYYGSSDSFNGFMEDISLVKYLYINMDYAYDLPITVPAVYLILASIGGYWAYSRNKCENNGKLMLFPAGETVLKIGFVICASLLGAGFLSSIFRNELVSYYIGLLGSLVLSTILIRWLTRVRLKV